MPDDQQQTPPINLADPAALTAAYQQYLQYLQQVGNQRPAQAPVISQAQLDANRPTSLLGQLGEALGGGAPSDVPMTADQRERAGIRGLFNFSRGLLGTGTFDTIGQALDRGFTEAERGQYNQEAQVAYGQAAAQDWQRQQMADRLAALKESIPLLQGIQRLNMPSLYGPGGGPGAQAGNTPGTVPGFTARDPKVPTVGQQGNNPGNVMADGGLPPGATGWIPASGGRKVAAFPDLTTGIAANAANLASYAGQGINTVRQAVTRWVGDPKADLGTYIADVSKALGVGADDKIDLTDPKVQAAFILAQQPHETGKSWFTPDDVTKGVQLAADWRSGKAKPPGATASQPAGGPPAANAAPGTLTAGAPATAAPQGVPLPPGGKPGETAGPAVGIGGALNPATAAKPLDQRAEVTGTGVAGRIPGAYDVASLGPVAPPSSATAPSPAATQPPAQPGWGTVIGSYGRGPAATAPTPAPPPGAVPQAPQPPAQQPPAQQPQTPPAEQPKPTPYAYPGDVKANPEEYMTQHFQPASAEEIKRYAPGPDGDVAAAAADQVRRAQANVQVQQRLLDEIHRGVMQGDVSKQAAEVEKANTELDAAQNKYNDTVRALTSEGAKNLLTRDDAERTRVNGNYQKVQDRAQQDAQQAQTLANNIRLKEIEGEQARLTNKEQVQNKVNQDTLAQASKDQIDARNLAAQVEGFQSVVENMGQPGWLQTTKNPFGQGESIAEKLGQMGWKVDDTGGYQMMQAGINEMIKSLRAGMPMGSLSDRDLDFIRRMGPNEWMDPDTRMAVTSYILQAARAKQQFSYEIQKELARPNSNAADAIDAADKKVKPFVPTVPPELTAHWTDQSPEWVQQRRQWAADNNIRPGTLYHLSNGDVLIAKRAPQTQAAPARPGPYVPGKND